MELILSVTAAIFMTAIAIHFYRSSLILKFQKQALQSELDFEKLQKTELEKSLQQQKDSWQSINQQMRESFQSLAHQTLEGQTRQFLDLATQTFSKQSEVAKNDLEKRQISIDNVITPLQKALETIHQHTMDIEKERQRSYSNVESELKRVVESSLSLSHETRALKNALKKPHVRGRWGEVQLKNCVELAGMSEYADVQFQDVNTLEDGQKLIPDMTVKMPGGRIVIVDAKTPIDAFIASLEASTEDEKNMEMRRHGMQVKEHIKKLALKSYNEHLKDTADFTVMFLPNESFLYAALETQPDLVEFAIEKKILIATPPTFVGLLKVIRYGWNEERLAANAEKIRDVGRELHKRAAEFVETYISVGKYLGLASDKYDEGLKRLNQRFMAQARKMEELGAKSTKELPEAMGFDIPADLEP